MRPLVTTVVVLLGLAGSLLAQAVPVRVQLTLAGSPPSAVAGEVVEWNDRELVLQIGDAPRTIAWTDIEPLSAFRTRSRLIDREDGTQWLELGAMGWAMGLKDAADEALRRAVQIDPALADKAQAIRDNPIGGAMADSQVSDATATATPTAPNTGELLKPAEAVAPRNFIEYTPSTPEQDAAAIEVARKRTAEVEQRLGLKLAEFQTPHFIVFTDWDPREYRFLEQNLEGAYRAVSRVFDRDPKSNIFEGKLAIYMFAQRPDFVRFGQAYGGMAEVPDRMAGYFAWRGQIIYMAMWKPDMTEPGVTRRIAELKWGYVLAHEFVHAFVYRYKTNRVPPLWVNEGLAESVAMNMFPMMSDYAKAAEMAGMTPSLRPMFEDVTLQRSFDYYPVHRTLIETLIARDRKAFIRWFDDLKYGMDPEEALQKHFGWDYATLEVMWRRYVAAVQSR